MHKNNHPQTPMELASLNSAKERQLFTILFLLLFFFFCSKHSGYFRGKEEPTSMTTINLGAGSRLQKNRGPQEHTNIIENLF